MIDARQGPAGHQTPVR